MPVPTQTPETGRTGSGFATDAAVAAITESEHGMPPPGAANEPPAPAITAPMRGRGIGNRGRDGRSFDLFSLDFVLHDFVYQFPRLIYDTTGIIKLQQRLL